MSEELFLAGAQLILDAAKRYGLTLRLLGSIAIRMHSETAKKQTIPRLLTDIDFVGHFADAEKIKKMMNDLEYKADEMFNSIHGSERLVFFREGGIRVDIFLDGFKMCHKLDFKGRLHLDNPTLTLADLLMTKLQIVQLNEKDLKDIVYLLNDHELCENDQDKEKINIDYISEICSKDWGLYKTFTMNTTRVLKHLDGLRADEETKKRVVSRCNEILKKIEEKPKSSRWKMRAMVGERKRWYEVPEV